MPTIAELSLPADSFALGGALTAVPEASFACESTVAPGNGVAAPLLTVTGAPRPAVDEAFRSDDTVESFDCLTENSTSLLYHVEWTPTFDLGVRMLAGSLGTVLRARASGTEWSIRILYPDRTALSTAHTTCETHGLPVDVETVHDLDPDRPQQSGITTEQREALVAACEHGYFDIPRRIDLRDLATEIGISHQALSERLRRGHDTLITEALTESEAGASL